MSGSRGALRLLALPLVASLAAASCSAPPGRPPDIILVVIDTVRADRLSCYGYGRPTSPRIDALAARGVRFENAASTSSWTIPAHASLFTGTFPIRHGATQEHARLDGRPATMAEMLGARGYATVGVSANPLVGESSGLARGFDVFVETWRARRVAAERRDVHPNRAAAERLLDGIDRERPLFLFVNYIEAHGPYLPPEPHRSRFLSAPATPAQIASAARRTAAAFYLDPASISPQEFRLLNDLYDGEIAHVDALVGDLVDFLERSGRLDEALLVVTSDHGENIGDHGHFRHVFSLYRSAVRIPLIALLPGGERAGQVHRGPVSLVDLFAAILSRAGVAPPSGQRGGRDIMAEDEGDQPIFAEYYYPLQALELFAPGVLEAHREVLSPHLRRMRSVEHGGLRLIWSSDGLHELFDLAADPDERVDLAGDVRLAERERRLHALLDDFVERGGGRRPLPGDVRRAGGAFGELDEEAIARLRELGYLR
jgi:arylsulfatase A-like enzyme